MFCMPMHAPEAPVSIDYCTEYEGMSLEKEAFQKARIVNQPAFFRGYVVFQVGGY